MKQEDYQELVKRVEAGLITMHKHPFLDLEICNYTAKTQYNKMWDNYTLMCRGLILDSQHNIIAKPFPKFFNLNETPETSRSNLPNEIPKISEKLDGVLGILYPEKNKVAISSRGSFTSDQAIWATGWMRNELRKVRLAIKKTNSWGVSSYEVRLSSLLIFFHTRPRRTQSLEAF